MNYKTYLIQLSLVVVISMSAYFVYMIEKDKAPLEPSWSAIAIIQDDDIYDKLKLSPVYGNSSFPLIFRLWMSPSWGKKTVITVQISNKIAVVNVKQFESDFYNGEFKVVNNYDKKLTAIEQKRFISKLRASNFLLESPEIKDTSGVDGWIWMVEASIRGKYVADEQWASTEGAFYEFSKALIDVSGLKFKSYARG